MAVDLETAVPQMCYITHRVYMPDLDGGGGQGGEKSLLRALNQ